MFSKQVEVVIVFESSEKICACVLRLKIVYCEKVYSLEGSYCEKSAETVECYSTSSSVNSRQIAKISLMYTVLHGYIIISVGISIFYCFHQNTSHP